MILNLYTVTIKLEHENKIVKLINGQKFRISKIFEIIEYKSLYISYLIALVLVFIE